MTTHRPILVKERLHIPLEYVRNPFEVLDALRIKNTGYKAPPAMELFGTKDKGCIRILGKEDLYDYSYFEMGQIDPKNDYLVVPRAFDIWKYLYPPPEGENYPCESDLLVPNKWRTVNLGQDNIQLGPNDLIKYNQTEAWEALSAPMEFPYGKILGLGCGKGKTVLALKLAYLRHVPTLVICHTRQMQNAWSDTAAAPWCLNLPKFRHGFIGDGKCKWRNMDIVFSTMPGLICRNYPDEFWKYFGLVIFDEGDLLGATELSQILPKFLGERVLLTATVDREDGKDQLYYNHVGPIIYHDIEPDLAPHCIVYDSKVPDTDKEGKDVVIKIFMDPPGAYVPHIPLTLSNIVRQFPERREWASNIAYRYLEEGRKILFLGERVQELKLYNKAAQEYWPKYKSGLALGGQHTTPEEIATTLKTCDIIWGIQHIAARGLNEPAIDTVMIQWMCFKKEGRLRQTIGRALRSKIGKKQPYVVLLNDPKIDVFDRKAELLTLMLKNSGYKVEWYHA